MARGTFKPEKSFKDVPNGNVFSKAVSDMRPTNVDDSANVNAWAKHVNQIDWESPVAKTDNPNDDITS